MSTKPGSASAPDFANNQDLPTEVECPKSELKPLGSISSDRIMKKRKALHFKLMFVGESGLGKTTAIKCFLHGLTSEPAVMETLSVASGSQPKTFQITEHGPFKLKTDDSRQEFITIVDSPGHGDNVDVQNDFDLIEKYFESQWSSLYADIKTKGAVDVSEHNSLVNACVYFISPHRLKDIDIEFMKRISGTVAIIPVIAKADTMTTEETVQFRKHVNQVLAEQGINVYSWGDCETGDVDREIRQRESESRPFPPFTLICAKDCVRRSYLWGDCRLDNEEHSDFLLLKNLLLEKHLLAMKEQATQTWRCKFYDVRQAELAAQDQQRARDSSWLRNLLLLSLAAAVLLLVVWNAGLAALRVLGGGLGCASASAGSPDLLSAVKRAQSTTAEAPAAVPLAEGRAAEQAGATMHWVLTVAPALLLALGAAVRLMAWTQRA